MMQNKWKIAAALAAASLLGGCGWFESSPAPRTQGARPGADRSAPVLNALPRPSGNLPHEGGAAPADETRSGATVGSLVTGKGGQKAQKEAAEKQLEEQSKKDRERAEREAEARKLRTAREKEASTTPGSTPAEPPQAAPPAAEPAAPQPVSTQPASPPPPATPQD